MPYVRRGKTVYKRTSRGLKKVGSSRSIKQSKAHLRVLNALHHGWKPTR